MTERAAGADGSIRRRRPRANATRERLRWQSAAVEALSWDGPSRVSGPRTRGGLFLSESARRPAAGSPAAPGGERPSCRRIIRSGSSRSGKPTGSRTRPSGPATSSPASPSSTSSTCSRTPAAPGCTSATPRATPPPTSSAATSGCAASTSCTRWAGTPSACPPSSTRSRPARTPGSPPRRTSTTSAARSSRSASPTTGTASRHHRPRLLPWTQWIFLQLFDTWYDPDFEWTDAQGRPRTGQGPPDRRAADPARARPTPTPIATPSASPIAPRSPSTGARSWARCWPTRKSSTARASAAATRSSACRCGSGCSGSPPTPTAWSTTSSCVDWPEPIKDMQRNWIGRSEGAEVDFFIGDDPDGWSARPAAIGLARDARPTTSSASSPPAPTPSSARPTWCSPPSTRSSIA